MNVIITNDTQHFNRKCAEEIANQIRAKTDSVLGFATGHTTEGVYRELLAMHRSEGLDFSRITAFTLDEYAGAFLDNPASCSARMTAQLFSRVNADAGRIHFMDSTAPDLNRVCSDYEERIRQAGGIDMQILGIGTNGHIAFNEPGAPFHSVTRVVDVGEQTVAARAAMFGSLEQVPRLGVSMGIKTKNRFVGQRGGQGGHRALGAAILRCPPLCCSYTQR
ncbi:glucosamine-6-phosphate deaminase [Paenibacillus tyrfis]|uniref:glucosamine-6-phosphate deaminase n=1 Tax=Paenibacillus tyrfis TaxID=1501230 RepID=UPI0009DE7867|nr:glucosamine-6-phosphate deaminase [Paenibacillus tyrfis]